MSEPEGFRVALVADGHGDRLRTMWFVEIGQVGGEPRYAEVGGDQDEDLSTEDVLRAGHTVRWYRLQPTDAPDGASRR